MPPATAPFRDFGGWSVNQNSFSSALKSVLTPVIQVIGRFSKARRRLEIGLGLGIRTLRAPHLWNSRKFAVKARIW